MHSYYIPKMPNTPGIYRITCTVTKKFYIGSAVSLRRRRKEHFGKLQENKHYNKKLQRAFNKYGPDVFVFEVLEYVLFPELLTDREQFYLDRLDPFGDRGFNINRVAESCLGTKRSPEVIEQKRIAGCLHTHSEDTRKLISSTRIEMGTSPKQMEQIVRAQTLAAEARRVTFILTSPDGTEYVVHGIAPFCREHNLIHSHLVNVARGKYKHHKGWKARFPENSTD